MRIYLLFLYLIGFHTNSYSQCDNTKPMYGKDCIKTKEMLDFDNEFINKTIIQFHNKDSAAKIYLRYGFRYLTLQSDPITSIKRFNQSWLINPNNPNVYFVFGLFTEFILSKDSVLANEYYGTGRKLDKDYKHEISTYFSFLDYFERIGDTATILKICDRAIKIDSAALSGYFFKKRGFYNLQMLRFSRCEEDLNKAILIDPKDATTFYNKASLYTAQKRIEEAKAINLFVLELDSKHKSALDWLLFYYWGDNKIGDSAIIIIDKILNINETPEAYNIKSEILFSQNKDLEGCNCLKKSLVLGLKENKKLYKQKCEKNGK